MYYKTLIIGLFCSLSYSTTLAQKVGTAEDYPSFLFEENKGQFHDSVLFKVVIPSGFLFIERNGLTYSFHNSEERHKVMEQFHHNPSRKDRERVTVHSHVLKISFDQAKNPESIGINPVDYYHNYFIGRDKRNWASKVRLYKEVLLRGVYENIDLRFYSSKDNSLKYDWVVNPGANFNQIKMVFQGEDSLQILDNHFIAYTSIASITERPPILTSQRVESSKLPEVYFDLSGNTLGFQTEFTGKVDFPFSIDPQLIFSTYSGSRGDNFGFTATYDSRSHLYAGGITDGSFGSYPVTSGAYQTEYGGGSGGFPANLQCDITISKYDSAGSKLLYATYLGGDDDEYPHSIVADKKDQLVIMGTTYSDNFPVTQTGYDTTHEGSTDIIVSKLSKDGTDLLASTLVGGKGEDGLNSGNLRYNYADDFRGDVFIDEGNNAYIASVTESVDFPTKDAYDNIVEDYEGCVFQLNSDFSSLLWSTFIGGSGIDALYSVKIDVDSNIVVGGGTNSDSLFTGQGTLNQQRIGGVDGIVAIFDEGSKNLKNGSYFGTASYDQIYFVEINNEGSIFVAGQTTGNITPSPGVYGQAKKGQFIAKLDTSLETIEFQTSFGVKNNQIDIAPTAFLVDNCEHIYMSGWGSNVNPGLHPGSTTDLEVTADAEQGTTDGNDFYIIVLDKDAQGLLYATYFGGDTTDDHVDGGTSRFDKRGVIYQSVCSSCPSGGEPGHQDFPVTAGAAFTQNFSPRCSNASFKIDLQIKTAVDAYFQPTPYIGCAPLDVFFNNKSRNQGKFFWDFGDGTVDSSNFSPNHIYKEPGLYTVSLVIIDSNTCNISDSYKRTIRVHGQTGADFTFELEPCVYEAEFTALSEGPEFFWDFGDGQSSTEKNPVHTYEPNQKFNVTLYTNLGTICADSLTLPLETEPKGTGVAIIPNIFTPNNDGFNDQFCLDGLNPNCDSIKWYIYNRWGDKVFESNSVDECWDGTSNGVEHPSGTYFSIFKIYQKELEQKYTVSGSVTLIRKD